MLGHWVAAASTMGTFLRSFTWGHVRQLDVVSGELLKRAWHVGAGPGAAPLTIDVDSTICKTLAVDEIKAPVRFACVGGPFGSNIAFKYLVSDGVPVIRGSNLTDDLQPFVADGFVFVSPEQAQQYKPQHVIAGDLVFTCWAVGQVGLIPDNLEWLFRWCKYPTD